MGEVALSQSFPSFHVRRSIIAGFPSFALTILSLYASSQNRNAVEIEAFRILNI
jgi:hypothetical protein